MATTVLPLTFPFWDAKLSLEMGNAPPLVSAVGEKPKGSVALERYLRWAFSCILVIIGLAVALLLLSPRLVWAPPGDEPPLAYRFVSARLGPFETLVSLGSFLLALVIFLSQSHDLGLQLRRQTAQIADLQIVRDSESTPIQPPDAITILQKWLENKDIKHFTYESGSSAVPLFWQDSALAHKAVFLLTDPQRTAIREVNGPDSATFWKFCLAIAGGDAEIAAARKVDYERKTTDLRAQGVEVHETAKGLRGGYAYAQFGEPGTETFRREMLVFSPNRDFGKDAPPNQIKESLLQQPRIFHTRNSVVINLVKREF